MGVYDRQIASAKRIIALKGGPAFWIQQGTPGGTAAKPTAGTPVEHEVIIAWLPIDREYLRTIQSNLDDTEIAGGYLQGLMAQVDFQPTLADTVRRVFADGHTETYTILPKNGIEELDPNGEGTILYTVRFSR
jgi:hypothetical protein